MISPVDRSKAVELIEEAVQSGATLDAACKEVGISSRTLNRWKKSADVDGDYIDHRTTEQHVNVNHLLINLLNLRNIKF